MLAAPIFVYAQAGPPAKPAAPPAAASAPAQPGAAAPAAPEPDPYTYAPDGRRDPFVSLISPGAEPISTGKHGEGLGGLTTAELSVKGVLLSRGTYIALVQGSDGKTFTAHANDRLVDGTIRSITPLGLVIMQDVTDPLSLVKVKEVRKGLRTSDDGKQ
jgi:hypothetical protein